jgi:methylated-DNA-[protein]-cysteine S-methyltransferase
MEISQTYYHSPVGWLKISGTSQYISEVLFHKEEQEPGPGSDTVPPMLINCVEQLIQYFNGGRRQFDLPLNPQGTAFQQDVWNYLASIPYGKTISYLDLAKKTGDSKATRAVANANGRNNIAIIIPCHRVIGSNRELVGYGGGLWKKKWLLDLEARVAHGVQTLF